MEFLPAKANPYALSVSLEYFLQSRICGAVRVREVLIINSRKNFKNKGHTRPRVGFAARSVGGVGSAACGPRLALVVSLQKKYINYGYEIS